MKYLLSFLFLVFITCKTKPVLTSKEILKNSIQKHDPQNQWNFAALNFHIQEPRIGNPIRYSIVKLNNKTGAFELQRNRNTAISSHIIDDNGNASTLLNGNVTNDSLLIKKYRLDPKRNFGYKRFYQTLYGLPMSLKNEQITLHTKVEEVMFNKKNTYKISLEFKEPLFSKDWNLYFSVEDFTIQGIEMVFPEDLLKGDRVLFDDFVKVENLLLVRMHHWYALDNTYAGSDIILKQLN
ncbi:DUF6503 family protein [uncultured Polaribacter sp.]|uniref:DUF6503 family protein n=1 Tax=uncultured Polaribacter sp. TaxID=174711 RepID=UPI00260FC18D|nr:DUF6503 family protein [uncultured Polaribacter sp.]